MWAVYKEGRNDKSVLPCNSQFLLETVAHTCKISYRDYQIPKANKTSLSNKIRRFSPRAEDVLLVEFCSILDLQSSDEKCLGRLWGAGFFFIPLKKINKMIYREKFCWVRTAKKVLLFVTYSENHSFCEWYPHSRKKQIFC